MISLDNIRYNDLGYATPKIFLVAVGKETCLWSILIVIFFVSLHNNGIKQNFQTLPLEINNSNSNHKAVLLGRNLLVGQSDLPMSRFL